MSIPPLRLACADDDEDIRAIVEVCLALDPSLHVETFDCGEALLARVARGGIDGVLLDVQMPGLGGLETCRQLKADPVTAVLPVVFLTGEQRARDRAAMQAAGGVVCLAKPFDPLTLATDVRTAVEEARSA